MAWAMEMLAIALVDHGAGEMGADIAIGHQPFAGQIDEDALGVLVRKVKDLPFILS
jgi:hypothetical protein